MFLVTLILILGGVYIVKLFWEEIRVTKNQNNLQKCKRKHSCSWHAPKDNSAFIHNRKPQSRRCSLETNVTRQPSTSSWLSPSTKPRRLDISFWIEPLDQHPNDDLDPPRLPPTRTRCWPLEWTFHFWPGMEGWSFWLCLELFMIIEIGCSVIWPHKFWLLLLIAHDFGPMTWFSQWKHLKFWKS